MHLPLTDAGLRALTAYSLGMAGTRDSIEAIGGRDYADLIIALARYDLPFPKPADTPARRAHVAAATALLQPLLRRDG